MALHLSAIHAADHDRADVRAARRVRENTHEELRDEVEKSAPILRWPLHPTCTTNRRNI